MKKLYLFLLLITAPQLLLAGNPDQPIVILFENDVHCAVDGYAKMAALRAEWLTQTPYVSVVSAGDFVQGGTIGSLSKGQFIIDLMNAVPYDVVTIGNHEFDYGIDRQRELMTNLTATAVCCNFTHTTCAKSIYVPYTIRQYGRARVAFIGAATPQTFTTSTPTYFQNSKGKVIYSFHPHETFEIIQKTALQARRKGADYVIVLSHLGDDTVIDNSVDMIRSTYGIDAVFDGHQHHILNYKIANAQGDSVILASTGTAFLRLGQCVIDTKGNLQVKLIEPNRYSPQQPKVVSLLDSIKGALASITGQVVGRSEVPLQAVVNGEREVRRSETNLTDLLTDAFREYTDADICLMNGGGVRNELHKGAITYGDVYAVLPFNNTMHKIVCTGQQIIDALEVGVKLSPEEDGDFFQVSGLRYTYRTDIPSPVRIGEDGLVAEIQGARRVVSVEVEDDDEWEPIDPNETYSVGGQSYILINQGAAGAIQHIAEEECPQGTDVDAVIAYIKEKKIIRADEYGQPQGRITRLP